MDELHRDGEARVLKIAIHGATGCCNTILYIYKFLLSAALYLNEMHPVVFVYNLLFLFRQNTTTIIVHI
jgi:hypothetical protein